MASLKPDRDTDSCFSAESEILYIKHQTNILIWQYFQIISWKMLWEIWLRLIENWQKIKDEIKSIEPPLFKIEWCQETWLNFSLEELKQIMFYLFYVHDLQIKSLTKMIRFIFNLIWKKTGFRTTWLNLYEAYCHTWLFIITQRRRWEHNVSKLTSPFGGKWNQFSSLCYFFIWLLSCCGIFSSSASFICCALSLIW